MRFTVMTFNVRGSFHEDGPNNWPNRRELNIATIMKYTPDIIGFQEAQSGNLEAFETGLVGYAVELGPISIRQSDHYHRVPIYWKQDRFEKVTSGGFYLSETPDKWSLSWGSTLIRAVTWVKLRELESKKAFVVLNTHFPHEQETDMARTESARLIVARLSAITGPDVPGIAMADFNTLPKSEAYNVFISSGYSDTYTAAGHTRDMNTFHAFQGRDFTAKGVRIDWILTRNGSRPFTVHRCDVLTDEAPPLYPSDHYPVMVNLELP